MKTFSNEEIDYLLRLRKRNYAEDFKNQTEPLTSPTSADEEKLRESIGDKCDLYIAALALAQIAGVLPNKKMKEAGCTHVQQVLDKLSWYYVIESVKQGNRE
jgi:hypothetical protein